VSKQYPEASRQLSVESKTATPESKTATPIFSVLTASSFATVHLRIIPEPEKTAFTTGHFLGA